MLAVAVKLGDGFGPPSDYPEFLPSQYSGAGQWGIAQKIRMEITPEPATLGLVAIGGVMMVLRRRRQRA